MMSHIARPDTEAYSIIIFLYKPKKCNCSGMRKNTERMMYPY